MLVKYNVLPNRFGFINRTFVASGCSYHMNKYLCNKRTCDKVREIGILYIPISIVVGVLTMMYRRLFSEKKRNKKDHLAIVTIVRNEETYIREWVSFHKLMGVDRIYIYDNESDDSTKNQIQDYIDSGYVVYKYYPGVGRQMISYNEALKDYGETCDYMAFIDCDEFITPSNYGESVVDILDDLFSKSPNIGGITLNWAVYSSSGHIERPKGLCIENYVTRASSGEFLTDLVKSVVRPECVFSIWHPHYPYYKKGYYGVDEAFNVVSAYYNPHPEYKRIRINHYYTKSKSEWLERRSRRTADGAAQTRMHHEFDEYHKNLVFDDCASKYTDSVYSLMRNNNSE